ncbi:MAG: nucleotidyltransferase family protein [Minisyncoccota bacterium]
MQSTVKEIATKAQPVFEKYGVTYAALFGSQARGDSRPDSDIDLLVEYGRPLGFEYAGLRRDLEEQLGCEVDMITEESMNEFLRPHIVSDLTPIYGEKR